MSSLRYLGYSIYERLSIQHELLDSLNARTKSNVRHYKDELLDKYVVFMFITKQDALKKLAVYENVAFNGGVLTVGYKQLQLLIFISIINK